NEYLQDLTWNTNTTVPGVGGYSWSGYWYTPCFDMPITYDFDCTTELFARTPVRFFFGCATPTGGSPSLMAVWALYQGLHPDTQCAGFGPIDNLQIILPSDTTDYTFASTCDHDTYSIRWNVIGFAGGDS